jgi:hypothetical protein
VKIYNVDQRYEANRIDGEYLLFFLNEINSFCDMRSVRFDMFAGHLQARLVYYLMNIHTQPRCIYLCRVSPHLVSARVLLDRVFIFISTFLAWRKRL